jgi:hypothetical protein
MVLADIEDVSLLTQGNIMKVKTNLRAGAGGVAVVKAAKVKSSVAKPIVYISNVSFGSSRCIGL